MSEGKTRLKKSLNLLTIVIIFLVIVLAILLLIEFVSFDFIERRINGPELIELQDRCSLIMGNLLHEIKSEGECKITCKNECKLNGMDFNRVEFIEKQNSCHTCNCYCE